MQRHWFFYAAIGLAVVHILYPSSAEAYLDPGSGSYVLQIVIAGLVAGLFAVKTFWTQLVSFFRNLFRRRGSSPRQDD